MSSHKWKTTAVRWLDFSGEVAEKVRADGKVQPVFTMIVQEVKYEQIMKHNPQLNSSARCNQEERQRLLRIYEEQGYDALDYDYIKRAGLKRFLLRLTCYVPRNLKKYLKRFFLKQ